VTFDDVTATVLRLYGERRYAEALDAVDDAERSFRDQAATLTWWRACLLSRLERLDEAMTALGEGSDRGMWWDPVMMVNDSDTEPLLELDAFEALRARSEARQQDTLRGTAPLPTMILRPTATPRAMIVALHGANGSAERFAPAWRSVSDRGYVVVLPNAPDPSTSDLNRYSWNDPDRVASVLRRAWEEASEDLSTLGGAVVVAGFSQGGGLALRIALRQDPIPVRGAIGLGATGHHLHGLLDAATSPTGQPVRICLIVGADDDARDGNEGLHAELRRAAIDVRLDVIPSLAHELPPDLGEVGVDARSRSMRARRSQSAARASSQPPPRRRDLARPRRASPGRRPTDRR
jgi:predicted esterase